MAARMRRDSALQIISISLALIFFEFIINAANTPGIHPQQVNINTKINEPHPLSIIAKGGKMMHKITLQSDILLDRS